MILRKTYFDSSSGLKREGGRSVLKTNAIGVVGDNDIVGIAVSFVIVCMDMGALVSVLSLYRRWRSSERAG